MTLATVLLLSLVAQGTPSADLSADSRLAADVRLTAPARTLEEVCRELSQATGIRIAVAEDVKETLVVVSWRGASARSLMERLASLFEWSWTKEGEGYRLVRTGEAERREKAEYDNDVLTPLKALQASLDKAIADAAHPLTEEESARITELKRALGTPPPAGATITIEDLEMRQRMLEELMRLNGRAAPANLMADIAFRDMTDEQLLAAARGRRVVLATSPTVAQHRLSDRAIRLAERVVRDAAEADPSGRDPFRAADVETVTVAFSPVSPTSAVLPRWVIRVRLRDGRVARTFRGELRGAMPNLDARPIGASADAALLTVPAPEPAMLTRILRAQLPLEEPNEPVARALISIADAAGRNLVGELADTMGTRSPWAEPGGSTCGEALDILCRLVRAEWKIEEGVITVRPSPYRMLYRARTIRRSVLRQAVGPMKEKWGLTLDELARIASLMTDDEWHDALVTTLRASGVVVSASFSSYERHYLLRAWSALGSASRARLLAGQPISIGSMGPEAARELWRHALVLGDEVPYFTVATLTPTAREQLGNALNTMNQQSSVEPTEAYATGLPRSAEFVLVHVREPAVGYRYGVAGTTASTVVTAYQAGLRASVARQTGRPDAGPGNELVPAVSDAYVFGILTGDTTIITALELGTILPGAKPVPQEQLPAEILGPFRQGRGGGGGP